jgi:GABA(A) receptor-associated protein
MSITTSYTSTGVLQPSFSRHPLTEMTTQTINIHSQTNSMSAAVLNAPPLTNDYLERVKKSQVILEKYPDRVPLIIQPSKNDRDTYPIDKSKYITPRDLTMMQLQQIVRKRIRFPSEKALFMFVNNKMFPITSMVGNIYDDNKDPDGFLYVTYCQENTFGA